MEEIGVCKIRSRKPLGRVFFTPLYCLSGVVDFNNFNGCNDNFHGCPECDACKLSAFEIVKKQVKK